MSRYYMPLDVIARPMIYNCSDCGAVVHIRDRHDEWHSAQKPLRYWVYLGSSRAGGPFPSYEEADRERRHCIDGGTLTARLNPQIYSIRTDGWEQR